MNLGLAVAGGFLPALVWLWFWLREDPHPEPKKALMFAFAGGMLAVPLAFAAEYAISLVFATGPVLVLLWALAEELLKYGAAWLTALRKPCFDEPVDAPVYLITAALGFSSAENILFVLKTFTTIGKGIGVGFINGNMRFIGANLLHVSASAIVGVMIAYAFFDKTKRVRNTTIGLILATLLHFLFNYSIIKVGDGMIIKVFIPVWLVIIIILYIFEKIKKIIK